MDLENLNDELQDNVYELEKDLINVDQYQRRNNIEFVGISNEVNQKQLEKHILEIVNKMGAKSNGRKVTSYDVVACHWLKRSPGSSGKNVIIRFKDRNIVSECIRRRKSLIKIRNDYNYKYLNVIEDLNKRIQSFI